jgi:hypothetical protein
MRYYKSVPNSDQVLAALMQKGGEVAHVLEMLQLASWNNWKDILSNQLRAADPTNPTPAEWAVFKDYVFRALKERRIENPEKLLESKMELDAKAAPSAPVKVEPPVEIDKIAAQQKCTERDPVALENRPATTSATSPPRAVARTVAYGTTKAEVLSRAKAAVEAGESWRNIAEILACANEDFHATQREIGQAIGRHPNSVNHVLKWRRSGYKEPSPFGPTTRAGRASRRKDNNGPGGRGRRSP